MKSPFLQDSAIELLCSAYNSRPPSSLPSFPLSLSLISHMIRNVESGHWEAFSHGRFAHERQLGLLCSLPSQIQFQSRTYPLPPLARRVTKICLACCVHSLRDRQNGVAYRRILNPFDICVEQTTEPLLQLQKRPLH